LYATTATADPPGPSSPLKKCFDGESHDQIRQIKEPDRRHIPDTSRFGDAELTDLGRS